MLDDVDIDWTASSRLTSFVDVCTLFDRVFAEPPYRWGQVQSERHRTVLASRAEEPGFMLVVARVANCVVGAAYGFPADGRWWQDVHPASAAESDTFTVSGLAVHQDWRRLGLGRSMLEQLLDGCGKARAAVAVLPNAIGAQRFYSNLGWQVIGRKHLSPTSPFEFLEIYSVMLDNL
ncbi:GNAT family N-acetyltransferase [Nocardia sp. CA-107356]|uniref:GNAT family N-acetyltransferase n=1 Tax=Nocardia sp. CA-107356 TaxID=3239972 RepID=UPI003D91950C